MRFHMPMSMSLGIAMMVACDVPLERFHETDAGASTDAPNADAPKTDSAEPQPFCDHTGTFDVPEPLLGFNTTNMERIVRLTSDELEIYFDGNLGGKEDRDIFRATRLVNRSERREQ